MQPPRARPMRSTSGNNSGVQGPWGNGPSGSTSLSGSTNLVELAGANTSTRPLQLGPPVSTPIPAQPQWSTANSSTGTLSSSFQSSPNYNPHTQSAAQFQPYSAPPNGGGYNPFLQQTTQSQQQTAYGQFPQSYVPQISPFAPSMQASPIGQPQAYAQYHLQQQQQQPNAFSAPSTAMLTPNQFDNQHLGNQQYQQQPGMGVQGPGHWGAQAMNTMSGPNGMSGVNMNGMPGMNGMFGAGCSWNSHQTG
jgi:hypothetical protein